MVELVAQVGRDGGTDEEEGGTHLVALTKLSACRAR